jgi:hypothetical protein
MQKTYNVIIWIIVSLIIVLFVANSFIRVGQGEDRPSRGIIIEWIVNFFNPVTENKTVDPDKIIDAIKYLESTNPTIMGKTPTQEEIFNSPHIKQIRIALNSYLDGTNTGLEDSAINFPDDKIKCGLNNFNKTYYQSKFIVLAASDNDYGGIMANIVFVDKPDIIFGVWVYGISGEQRLRTFCEKPITSQDETDYTNEVIKNSAFQL